MFWMTISAIGRALRLPALLVLLFPLTVAAIDRAVPTPVLSASEFDYPPYCIVNEKQEADGFSAELLRAALRAMGQEVTFQVGHWREVKQSLADGKVQVLPLVGRTPEREALFDFTFPYLTMHGTIVVRAGETGIGSLADLQGKKVAVMRGDNAEEFVRRSNLGVTLVSTATFREAMQGVADDRYDAVIIQKLLALQLIRSEGLDNLKTVGPPLEEFAQDFCFAVRKGDHKLLRVLNEGLSIVTADGTFRHLHSKWFGPIENFGRIPSRIVVGGDHDYPPYEFIDANGQPAGYNIELTRAIARRMGLSVDFRLGPRNEIRKELAEGKIDLVQGMFYSPEWDQTFDFSPAYTVISHVMVTRSGTPHPGTIADLADKVVVVMAGDIMHELVSKQGRVKQLVTVSSQEEALRLLAAGQYDCALVARIPALHWIRQHGWDNLRVGEEPVTSPEYGYAVLHGNGELLRSVNEGLASLKHAGEYRAIHARWLGVYDEPNRKFLKTLLSVVALLLTLLGSFLAWSVTLRRQVRSRTRELQREIDEHKRTEKSLRESEEHYRALVNTIPHGITVMDPEHRILMINEAQANIYQHPPEWFIGRFCYEVFEKRQQVCPHCPGVASLRSGQVEHTEAEGVLDDGSRVSVRLHTAPFSLADDRTGFIEVVEDITARRQLEAKTQQMARLASLGEMATGVAHEINNPINGIVNCAQLLNERLPIEHPCQGIADRILREGNRIARIVRSLLSICHPGELSVEPFSVRDCFDSVLALSREKLISDGIDLQVDLPVDLLQIRGERQQIEQLLLNLINNAHHALNARFPEQHPDKRLLIGARRRMASGQEWINLKVYDQGIGIRREVLGRIFDPFFTTKPAGVGTGLGLGICHEIVMRHGGEIRVESEFGSFTQVTIELPLRETTVD